MPKLKLTKKKIKSLGKKYGTIPDKFLQHYPSLSVVIRREMAEEEQKEKNERGRLKKKPEKSLVPRPKKKRNVGRPPKPKLKSEPVSQAEVDLFFKLWR